MPLLVKLSPDLDQAELEVIVDVITGLEIDGIIATNTTTHREHLSVEKSIINNIGEGGLSGAPLRQRSTQMIASLYQLTGGKIPLIGVGGIFTTADAWEKIAAGASLVQLYTGFIYQGPGIAKEISEGLASLVSHSGFKNIDEAVGHLAKEVTA